MYMQELSTKRLLIRKFRESDWCDLYEYLSDPSVTKYEPYDVFSADTCRKEAKKRAGNPSFWAVCLKDTGKLIGNLYFDPQDFGTRELGYVFNRRYWHQGYAIESAQTLIGCAFRNWGARRIIAACNPENTASWHLLEQLHMRREGHLRQNIYFKKDGNGQPLWVDTYLYALLASEWQSSEDLIAK
jgi:RimJ/RimL family protein N-acetyltransferase